MFKNSLPLSKIAPQRIILVGTLLASLIVCLLPRRATESLAALYSRAVEPGQVVAGRLRTAGVRFVERARHASTTGEEVVHLRASAEQLRQRNQELEVALALAQRREEAIDPTAGTPEIAPLVLAEGVRARVLGRRACAVLPAAEIVALGHTAGARREALALVDSSWTIDSGRDTQIAAGDMALAGRRVFGKVMEVGAHTCVVRRADQAGYRDVVQLAARAEGTLRFGAKGILEGTGEGHARLRLVNASDAVAPGDLVLTAGQQGLASQALWYGTVARCERRQGAPHWDIWVDLAAERDDPAHLIVLRAELNPARLAASPESPVARH